MAGFLKRYGANLIDNGYSIVPIKSGTKYPGFEGWQKSIADKRQLSLWTNTDHKFSGVGVIARFFPAIDIDIRDDEVVDLFTAGIKDIVGDAPARIGEAPKKLLVFRTSEPFPKLSSNIYECELGLKHQVEILGDGQQWVAFAKHPDTKQPYTWVGESILDIPSSDLPELTESMARDVIAYFESIIPSSWRLFQKVAKPSRVVNEIVEPNLQLLQNIKPPVDISEVRIKRALRLLDADEYHQWCKVGMALYHQYEGSNDGFTVWDDWSSVSDKYEQGACLRKWKTFKADIKINPTTFLSVLDLVKKAKEELGGGDPVDEFLGRYIYIADGDRVCDLQQPPHQSIFRIQEFRNYTANVRHEVPAPTVKDPDKVKIAPVSAAWLVHADRADARGTTYDPVGDRLITDEHGTDWVNEFHLPQFSYPCSGSIEVFLDHMEYLLPSEVEREWFISWIAFNVQFPSRRCKVTPLHISSYHGTGRGWVVELMQRLLGPWNCTKTKMQTLSGEGGAGAYNDYLDRSLLCSIEEVKEQGKRFAVSDRIRDTLTEIYLEVNCKYGSKKTKRIYTNFFFMSNHPDALVITEEDRRINCFAGPDYVQAEGYYNRLYSWLESDQNVATLHSWLKSRDLGEFNWTRSFSTPTRVAMIEANQTNTEQLFRDMMKEPPFPAMTFEQIKEYLFDINGDDIMSADIEEKQLLKLLQHHAKRPTGGDDRVKIYGRVRRVWLLTQRKLTKDEIKNSIIAADK